MMIHKSNQVLITIEMTEEQSNRLRTALMKVNEFCMTSSTGETLSKEEAEVMNDLRLSLLNS